MYNYDEREYQGFGSQPAYPAPPYFSEYDYYAPREYQGFGKQPAYSAPIVSTTPAVATTTPTSSTTTGGGGYTLDIFPYQQALLAQQYELGLMHEEYLRQRIKLLEVPEMLLLDERQRHQLALQAVQQFAEQSGWIVPTQQLDRIYNPETGATGMTQWNPIPNAQQLATMNAVPTMAMQQMMANPRNIVQSLVALGMTAPQIQQSLGQVPLVKNLLNQGWGQTNPQFPFIAGYQLPARQVNQWKAQGSPMLDIMSSLASYSGQEPESFWQQQQSSLPQGSYLQPPTYR